MKDVLIEKEYIYHGFGFPVILRNVPMIDVRGILTPDIRWGRLEKIVLLMLAHQSCELTGNQVRFIRNSMEMNQREFSDLFKVTHAAVVKWERAQDNPTKMHFTTQIAIRMRILNSLLKDDKAFRQAYQAISSLVFQEGHAQLEIDTQTDLIAI